MTTRITPWALGLGLASGCNAINPDLLTPGEKMDAAMQGADASSDMPEPGLILRYSFEDVGSTAHDVSGRHMDGTVYLKGATPAQATPSTTAWTDDGRVGHGIAFGGTQYVSLPSGVLEGVDDFTIASWVKVKSDAPWMRIYDFGNATGDQFMYLTIDGFQPNATMVIPDGVHASSFGGSTSNENWLGTGYTTVGSNMVANLVPSAVWKHVVVTGSGGDRHIYIDGFPVVAKTGPNVPPRQMEPMSPNSWLGKSHFTDSNNDALLNGSIDEFRIYSRVLTTSEIADLAWPQHDYSYWRFDEGTGATAKDSSDNAIGGTLNDLSWTTGRLNGALRFPGAPAGTTGPFLSLASNPLAACSEFTVAAWVNPSLLDSSHIFDFGTATDTYAYLALNDGTGLHFSIAATGKTTFNLTATSQPLTQDAWHHVAVTMLSGTATIYVDGVSVATAGGAVVKGTDLGATTQNWVGRSRTGDRYLSGAIDELRIGCRALTANEILFLSRP